MTGRVDALGVDTVLRVRELSIVAHGGGYLVGNPDRTRLAVLPEIGLRVIELLRSGRSVGEVAATETELAGIDFDVIDFARALCVLGFAEIAGVRPRADPANGSLWITSRVDWVRLEG